MFKDKYFMIQGIYTLDGQKYIGYGIEYRNQNQVITFDDVSIQAEKISSLVALCNAFDLSADHLCDIIEDFLADVT